MTIITRTVALVAAALLVLTAGAQAGRESQAGRYTSLSYPVWSPDGKHVAWVAGTPENNVNETYRDTVRVADSSGRKVRPLHSFPGQGYPFVQLAWVTPTSLLVATAGPLYRLDLSGRVRLLPQIQTGFFVSLDPSRRFVAAGSEDCPQPDCAGSIKVLNLRTGKVRRVGSPADLNSDPVLSPGAGRVVYHRTTCDLQAGVCDGDLGIWMARVDGRGKPHRILGRAQRCPRWSPNGRLIAYLDERHEPFALGVLRVGGRKRLITSAIGCVPLSSAAFSPDSRFIAYPANSVRGTPGSRIAVVDVKKRRVVLRSPRRLGQVEEHAWSPDGSKILLIARYFAPEGGLGCMYVGNLAQRQWRLFRPCDNAE